MTKATLTPERVWTEQTIPLAEAAGLFAPVASMDSIRGWIRFGLRIGGTRVHLEVFRKGGRVWTSKEAVSRFATRTGMTPAPALCLA